MYKSDEINDNKNVAINVEYFMHLNTIRPSHAHVYNDQSNKFSVSNQNETTMSSNVT